MLAENCQRIRGKPNPTSELSPRFPRLLVLKGRNMEDMTTVLDGEEAVAGVVCIRLSLGECSDERGLDPMEDRGFSCDP